jgi:hypothetical protein
VSFWGHEKDRAKEFAPRNDTKLNERPRVEANLRLDGGTMTVALRKASNHSYDPGWTVVRPIGGGRQSCAQGIPRILHYFPGVSNIVPYQTRDRIEIVATNETDGHNGSQKLRRYSHTAKVRLLSMNECKNIGCGLEHGSWISPPWTRAQMLWTYARVNAPPGKVS